jgi:hypothetical protein
MQSPTLLGIGIFKGKSLCFTQADISAIHQRFYALYKNKALKDQEMKFVKQMERKETLFPNQTTFSPKISEKSNKLALKAKSREISQTLKDAMLSQPKK